MAETIICDVYYVKSGQNIGLPVIIQIDSSNGASKSLFISKGHQRIILQEGDRVTCLQGHAYFHVEPGTPATGFHLKQQLTPSSDGERTDQAVISKKAISAIKNNPIKRGKIEFKPDIGNTSRGTGAVTR